MIILEKVSQPQLLVGYFTVSTQVSGISDESRVMIKRKVGKKTVVHFSRARARACANSVLDLMHCN